MTEKNLAEDEAGLLILREEDRLRLQFSDDIDVFFVTPPVRDDILKWIRGEVKAGKIKRKMCLDFGVVGHEGGGTTEEIADGCSRIACEVAVRKIENGAGS
jgi:hypothetical protein